MHGSKAYLEQLANKLLIQVEICSKSFTDNKGSQNILISQLKKRELNLEERNILSKNFKIKKFVDIVESSKIKIDSKVYHSKIYYRKRNSDSYTISFDHKGSTEYAHCD